MRYKVLQKIKELNANELVQEYLIHCCLYYELAVQKIDNDEFRYLVKCLKERWNESNHPYKELIRLEVLRESGSGWYIKYPSLIRSCACHIAAAIPGGPMYGRSIMFINSYVCALMPKAPTK